MPPDPVFGAAIGAHHVDKALVGVLQMWTPTYLVEVARRSGEEPDELKPFRGWRVSADLERMPEDQTPLCIIANKGLDDQPEKYNTSRPGMHYEAIWRYQIGCHISARGKKINASPRAQTLAKMYALAVRMCLVQKRDEPDLVTGERILNGMIDWIDEDYDGLESDADRTICMAYVEFNVTVTEVTTWGSGPKDPIPDPTPVIPTDPLAEEIISGIVKVPSEDPIEDHIGDPPDLTVESPN